MSAKAPQEWIVDFLRGELLHRQAGQNEDKVTFDESFCEPDGVLRELFVLATTQDRGVRVDPRLHDRILSEMTAFYRSREGCVKELPGVAPSRGFSPAVRLVLGHPFLILRALSFGYRPGSS